MATSESHADNSRATCAEGCSSPPKSRRDFLQNARDRETTSIFLILQDATEHSFSGHFTFITRLTSLFHVPTVQGSRLRDRGYSSPGEEYRRRTARRILASEGNAPGRAGARRGMRVIALARRGNATVESSTGRAAHSPGLRNAISMSIFCDLPRSCAHPPAVAAECEIRGCAFCIVRRVVTRFVILYWE